MNCIGGYAFEFDQGGSNERTDDAIAYDEQPVVVQPLPRMDQQLLAVGAVCDLVAQDTNQGTALVLSHPSKTQGLAGLLLVIEQGAATSVQRAQRGQIWRRDFRSEEHT